MVRGKTVRVRGALHRGYPPAVDPAGKIKGTVRHSHTARHALKIPRCPSKV
jgi:hypothetical protein